MNDEQDATWRHCATTRATIQEALDAGAASGSEADWRPDADMQAHLADCDACWEFLEGQIAVRDGLRSIGMTPFPEDALRSVWAQTVDAPAARRSPTSWRRRSWVWRAAAALALAAGAWMWMNRAPAAAAPGPEVLARAAAETRMVFEITNDAFARVERAAINEALVTRVSGVLLRIPARLHERFPDKL
jgi:hypothetical protein